MQTQIQSLQNAANEIGLTIHEKIREDKRKTVAKYFATEKGATVSPALDYDQLNCFLLGWIKAAKNQKRNYE